MANIKELKKRIKSTKSSYKITSAMKLVSAAKLARAQQEITQSRPYGDEIDRLIKVMTALSEDYSHPYMEKKEGERKALLVFSSYKGLCGGYNNQLMKAVKVFMSKNPGTKLYFVGNKLNDILSKDFETGKTFEFEKSEPSYQEIVETAEYFSDLFEMGEITEFSVAYNVFVSAIQFDPTIKSILPISLKEAEKEELKTEYPFDFKYDENPTDILDELVPMAFNVNVRNCFLDAMAAEHGSRMSAMDSASKNCSEMIQDLTLKMNKLRQAAITTELIEVVSGAESLKG